MPLEDRTRLESDVIPRVGDYVVLPGERHRDNAYPVERVRFDWSGSGDPEVWVYLGSPAIEH